MTPGSVSAPRLTDSDRHRNVTRRRTRFGFRGFIIGKVIINRDVSRHELYAQIWTLGTPKCSERKWKLYVLRHALHLYSVSIRSSHNMHAMNACGTGRFCLSAWLNSKNANGFRWNFVLELCHLCLPWNRTFPFPIICKSYQHGRTDLLDRIDTIDTYNRFIQICTVVDKIWCKARLWLII
jgi:hypothetical protein